MSEIAAIDVIVPPPTVIEITVGTKGDPGPPGPAGAPGGSSSVFFYKIDANATGQSDPGTGKLRYNHATQNLATAFYVDWITDDGFDAHLFFARTAPTTHIVLQDADLAVNYQEWELTGPPINYPDWFEVPVRFVSSNGAGRFTHNTRIAALLITESDPLPTAPLGQVLVSQGDGVAPVFSPVIVLQDLAGGNGGWRFVTLPSGNLQIARVNAAGVQENPHLEVDPYIGGLSTIFGGFGALNGNVAAKWLTPAQHTLAELMAVASAYVGNLATVQDSTTNTPGAVISGGGTFIVFARWNGANWIVISG